MPGKSLHPGHVPRVRNGCKPDHQIFAVFPVFVYIIGRLVLGEMFIIGTLILTRVSACADK